MGMGQSGGRWLDSDIRQLHRRVRPLQRSWGSRQFSSTEHVYPSPRASTNLSATTSAASRCSPPPPQLATPCTIASTATPTPARVEHNLVEIATPLSHDEEHIDVYHDGESLRYRTMENLLGDRPVPGLVPHDLEAQLHLTCDDCEPRSFAEAERHAAWRAAMQSEMDAVEKNRTWDEVGAIVKHKARLVGRDFVQRVGIDFDDTFAPVARMESMRLLCAGCLGMLACSSHGCQVGVS
jgi:hypothetical protein